jgi:Protein phosphatase 2C
MRQWCWVGACSIGSSHVKAGTVCQDAAACIEVKFGGEQVLLVMVSDGAGSAQFSAIGSHLVVEGFTRCVLKHLRSEQSAVRISEEIVRSWLDDIRDKIFQSANRHGTEPRQLAATLVAAILFKDYAVICHIGDGACVLRRRGNISWEVPSWPAHGEYASSTYFITDDPQPNLQYNLIESEVSEVAVFSDGIERLVLDFSTKCAFEGFFEPMFRPLEKLRAGRDRSLSASLRKYLGSPGVLERTDDDKSLVMARRVVSE